MIKRSVTINGHRTSVALEAEFWQALEQYVVAQNKTLVQVVADVDATRGTQGLASALRVFILNAHVQ